MAKKFAPEIEVPAQKNQICSLSLFMAEYDVVVARQVPVCWPEVRASLT